MSKIKSNIYGITNDNHKLNSKHLIDHSVLFTKLISKPLVVLSCYHYHNLTCVKPHGLTFLLTINLSHFFLF